MINILEKVGNYFVGILLVFLVILGIGYLIVNFTAAFSIPIIIILSIFGIYQLLVHIFK